MPEPCADLLEARRLIEELVRRLRSSDQQQTTTQTQQQQQQQRDHDATGAAVAATATAAAAAAADDEDLHWMPSLALANRYANGDQHVGFHSDFLLELGPRPIIAGLSLGATRPFRLKRQQMPLPPPPPTTTTAPPSAGKGALDDGGGGSGGGSGGGVGTAAAAVRSVSVPMPHNSVCIMWDDCQEEWLHAVPKVAQVQAKHRRRRCHHRGSSAHGSAHSDRSGGSEDEVRISLTFRMARPQFAREHPVTCQCGAPAALKSKNGRYFLYCNPTKLQQCRFWEPCRWADEEARRLRGLKKKKQLVRAGAGVGGKGFGR